MRRQRTEGQDKWTVGRRKKRDIERKGRGQMEREIEKKRQ